MTELAADVVALQSRMRESDSDKGVGCGFALGTGARDSVRDEFEDIEESNDEELFEVFPVP